jgi:hypothetical protein
VGKNEGAKGYGRKYNFKQGTILKKQREMLTLESRSKIEGPGAWSRGRASA